MSCVPYAACSFDADLVGSPIGCICLRISWFATDQPDQASPPSINPRWLIRCVAAAAIDGLSESTRKLHDQLVAHSLMFQLDLRPHERDTDDASSWACGGASSSGSIERVRAAQALAKIARCVGVYRIASTVS